jgi:hypothetical protein
MERSSDMQRRRFKQQITLQDRLAVWAKKVRGEAAALRPGPEKDALLQKASQADVAAHFDGWVHSSSLRPPK